MLLWTVLIIVRAPPTRLEMVESIMLNRSPSPARAGKGAISAISKTKLIVLMAKRFVDFFIVLPLGLWPAARAPYPRSRTLRRCALPAVPQVRPYPAGASLPAGDSAHITEARVAASSTMPGTSARADR